MFTYLASHSRETTRTLSLCRTPFHPQYEWIYYSWCSQCSSMMMFQWTDKIRSDDKRPHPVTLSTTTTFLHFLARQTEQLDWRDGGSKDCNSIQLWELSVTTAANHHPHSIIMTFINTRKSISIVAIQFRVLSCPVLVCDYTLLWVALERRLIYRLNCRSARI